MPSAFLHTDTPCFGTLAYRHHVATNFLDYGPTIQLCFASSHEDLFQLAFCSFAGFLTLFLIYSVDARIQVVNFFYGNDASVFSDRCLMFYFCDLVGLV